MRYILLLQQIDTLRISKTEFVTKSYSIWLWLSIIEFILIAILFYLLYNKRKKLAFSDLSEANLKESKNTDIDMDNIMNSIIKSRELYKELSSVCHPDRFVNTSKEKIANDIFQEISKNKRDYKELSLLKERAIKELDLIFLITIKRQNYKISDIYRLST